MGYQSALPPVKCRLNNDTRSQMKKERKKKFLSSRTPSGVQSELKTCTLISLSVPSPPLFCFVARFIRSIINERVSERIEGGVGDGRKRFFFARYSWYRSSHTERRNSEKYLGTSMAGIDFRPGRTFSRRTMVYQPLLQRISLSLSLCPPTRVFVPSMCARS